MGGNYSDGELAWTSFDRVLKEYTKRSEQGGKRFHPTQKPIGLYNFILQNYANPGDKIIDTHLGSGNIAVACHYKGFDLTASEIDTEYFNKAMNNIRNRTAQVQFSFNNL